MPTTRRSKRLILSSPAGENKKEECKPPSKKASESPPVDEETKEPPAVPEETKEPEQTDSIPPLESIEDVPPPTLKLQREQTVSRGNDPAAAPAEVAKEPEKTDETPPKIMIGDDVVRVILDLLKAGRPAYSEEQATFADTITSGFAEFLAYISAPRD